MGLWWWLQPPLGNENKKWKKITGLTGFELRNIGISLAIKTEIKYREISFYNNSKFDNFLIDLKL